MRETTELLERLTAWIPTESIAVFLSFGGFFSVFDDTAREFARRARRPTPGPR